jgi:hypothetical protein
LCKSLSLFLLKEGGLYIEGTYNLKMRKLHRHFSLKNKGLGLYVVLQGKGHLNYSATLSP